MFAVFRAKKGSKPVRVSPEYYSPERCDEYIRAAKSIGLDITGWIVMIRVPYAIKGWERFDPLFDNTTAS